VRLVLPRVRRRRSLAAGGHPALLTYADQPAGRLQRGGADQALAGRFRGSRGASHKTVGACHETGRHGVHATAHRVLFLASVEDEAVGTRQVLHALQKAPGNGWRARELHLDGDDGPARVQQEVDFRPAVGAPEEGARVDPGQGQRALVLQGIPAPVADRRGVLEPGRASRDMTTVIRAAGLFV
jgi:hypothetical protein